MAGAKEDKASMMFGRCFENALAAYLVGKTRLPRSLRNGANTRKPPGLCEEDSWDRLYHQGIHLRRTVCPRTIVFGYDVQENLQVKLTRFYRPEVNSFRTSMRSAS